MRCKEDQFLYAQNTKTPFDENAYSIRGQKEVDKYECRPSMEGQNVMLVVDGH